MICEAAAGDQPGAPFLGGAGMRPIQRGRGQGFIGRSLAGAGIYVRGIIFLGGVDIPSACFPRA